MKREAAIVYFRCVLAGVACIARLVLHVVCALEDARVLRAASESNLTQAQCGGEVQLEGQEGLNAPRVMMAFIRHVASDEKRPSPRRDCAHLPSAAVGMQAKTSSPAPAIAFAATKSTSLVLHLIFNKKSMY